MTTTTTNKSDTRFPGLPKNKTGLFAADTIHEVKSTRNHLITVPALSPQFRNNASTSVLLASSEQNHHQLQQYRSSANEIQQYYPLDGNNATTIDCSNDSRLTVNGVRNGFRPSTVRHQKLRLTTATAQRNNIYNDNKDSPPKTPFIQSHASAKLKSEIDHISSKLRKHGESSASFRFQNNRDLDGTPQSDFSYSTSCRLSSASTTFTADRIHQRFSSAITNVSANIGSTMPTINDTSNQTSQIISGITPTSPPPLVHETENNNNNQQDTTDYRTTHAYQIPQQSNVGSESIFLTDTPIVSAMKTRSAKNDCRQNDLKSVSCPFYVMYLTNLTIHQRQNKTEQNNNNNNKNNAHDVTPLGTSSLARKVPFNSRISTAHIKNQSIRRQVNSPISMNTYSTIDDEDYMTISTSYPNNRRLSAKISSNENENSHMLGDILRTSSWNHVQV
ncbi:unnamed protein product [Rotaria sordida]|uniref:Uncharacterized protein n=1 Tax=Rotaria sordida TaxID=392033 RepID=A0A818RFM3_9BILA|nr:unnamed protein product [Rotaria sordida]CAF1000987.1 unnamed protein product [Rotaria sordida]CAF1128234.1 unnamed protein product [Rotaria sordida]CAF1163271.1 unnamed protein product [Rotaria sordida]CAF1325631.1 unnamed protein product [Rotaria sordida]